MIKRTFNIGLVLLIFLLTFHGYAGAETHNPFEYIDKEYEKRLDSLKDSSHEMPLQRSLSTYKSDSNHRFLVKFKDETSLKEIHKQISSYTYKIIGKSENRVFLMELEDKESFKKEALDYIEFIEKDLIREASHIPSDEYYDLQWGLPALNFPKAWDISKGSNQVIVAVIDSGIQRRHPDLIDADIRNGWDYLDGGHCNWDSTGHGTNISGIIGAKTNNGIGIVATNWNVALIPLRVANYEGAAYLADTIDAIYDAADLGSHVINLSFGSTQYSVFEKLAVEYAMDKGSLVVAAAGNKASRAYDYPASYEGVVSVGSVGRDYKLSHFSQYNDKVRVVAPGEEIYTTMDMFKYPYHNYGYVNGTSYSTAYVSGIAALMKSVKPSMTQREFIDRIKLTSTDLGATGYDIYYGHGLIDAEKMLESVTKLGIYTDTGSHWGKEAIVYLAQEGVVEGYPDGKFKPDSPISRAEFAAMINRIMKFSDMETITFKDVPKDSWYYEDVAKAVKAGYANGYPENLFKPKNHITRQEASVMIARALNLEEVDMISNSFSDDKDISPWARGFVNAVKEANYIQGHNNRFRPTENITRAEAATILYRVFSS